MLNGKKWDRDKVMNYLMSKIETSARGIDFILKSAEHTLPRKSTVMGWMTEDEKYHDRYARAREEQAHYMRGENIEIADNVGSPAFDADGNMMFMPDGSPVIVVDASSVAHAKLRIETRRWTMGKLLPKKYGDRIQQEHTGNVSFTSVLSEIDGSSAGLDSD